MNTQLPQLLKCIQGKQAAFFCSSSNCCKPAIICKIQDCPCSDLHNSICQQVPIISIISNIIPKLNTETSQLHRKITEMKELYYQIIISLTQQKDKIKQWQDNYWISQQQNKFVTYAQQKQCNYINGKLINKIKLQQLNNKKTKKNCHRITQKINSQFWKQRQHKMHLIISLLQGTMQKQQFITNLTIESYGNVNCYNNINSKIVSTAQQLIKYFPIDHKPIEFKLLYRASENKFRVDDFHRKCDKINHTLTLISTQYDKIIGGYTPVAWKALQVQKFAQDKTNESFLFSISLDEKYPLINSQQAIFHSKKFGPTFGNGHDIWISNDANKSYKNYFFFPGSYNNGKYEIGQKAQTAFCGALEGCRINIKEWEVFEVIWKIN